MADPVAVRYAESLRELDSIELNVLKVLRDHAKDHLASASSIVQALGQHLQECPAHQRLPAFYLVDFIMKTVQDPYVQLFAPILPEMFSHMWDTAAPDVRAKMAKTAGSWEGPKSTIHVPPAVLAAVRAKMNSTVSLAAFGTSPAVATQQSLAIPSQPAALQAYTAAQPAQPSSMLPFQPANHGLVLAPQPYGFTAPQVNPSQIAALLNQHQQQHQQQHQAQAILAMLQPNMTPSQLQLIMQAVGLGHAPNLQLTAPAIAPVQIAPPVAPFMSAAQVAMQGQPVLSQPLFSSNIAQSAANTPLSDDALRSSIAHLKQQLALQAAPAVLPTAGGPLGGLPASPHPAAMPAHAGPGSQHGAPPRYELSQQHLKEPNVTAVTALQQASAESRNRFLDLRFLRNRRLQEAQHRVRHWYTSSDQWLLGLRSVQEAPVSFFEEEQEEKGTGGAGTAMVEEDPSQPTCAISGEAFERTYDPDTDRWYYDQAVVLTGDQAAAFGVMEGSIVKRQCIAGAAPQAPQPAAATSAASAAQLPAPIAQIPIMPTPGLGKHAHSSDGVILSEQMLGVTETVEDGHAAKKQKQG